MIWRSGCAIIRRDHPGCGEFFLVALLAPILGQGFGFPLLHRRVREHVVDPSLIFSDFSLYPTSPTAIP